MPQALPVSPAAIADRPGHRKERADIPRPPEHIHTCDDATLLVAIRRGAEQAMEELYRRYYNSAYALAFRILRNSFLAEDIVQDVFLTVWNKASSFQSQQGSARSWLHAIVHHRAIDRLRSFASHDTLWISLPTAREQDFLDVVPEVWEEAWQHECGSLVHDALAQLPIEQRQVIELGYFNGYSHVEIAERSQIPLGTVKGRMRLGLRKMKLLLHEKGLDTL